MRGVTEVNVTGGLPGVRSAYPVPMAKPTKRRVQGGRVTPRGTRPENEAAPRVPVSAEKISPIWVPVLMIALLVLGAIMIVLNYVALLPGDTSNWYLLGGLGLLLAGMLVATQWH
ncbi:MAG: cell division protein CrgA [Acidimicrobiia bacterium]|nr:cell division protein CrgA [Acidimicrobiia bacterium]